LEVTVVVGTFGDEQYRRWAEDRAIPSVPEGIPVVHVHGGTLAESRNAGLAQVKTEWVVFLDADDELAPGYMDAMATGSADLRAPSVRYVKGRRTQDPYVPRVAGHDHDCTGECLPEGNWLVIGAAARADLLRSVGGFREWDCYEDWDLWLRCWLAGATVEAIPAAEYIAHVRPDSRNRSNSMRFRNRVHVQIIESVKDQL
jgi:GT2 family glycosyltransferase